MGIEFALYAVEEDACEIDQQGVYLGKATEEKVESNRGRDCHCQTYGCCNQSFGNAGGYSGERC